MNSILPQHDVVLLGVGHTNAHVLRMWRMEPIPRARLTCISNSPIATYSGMLPGVLAGQYEPKAMEIDLVRLCAAAGARLILGEVTGLDHQRRELQLAGRPPIPYDVLSIGIGSVPARSGLVSADETLLPIKPMQTFLARLDERLLQTAERGAGSGQPLEIVIAGGGVGGVEIAFCLPRHIEHVLPGMPFRISIVEAGDHVGAGLNPLAATNAAKLLASRRVKLLTGRRVTQIAGGQVWLDDGDFLPASVVLWATSASPPPLLAKLDLPKDERGFLLTHWTLESVGSTGVFVVGDTGTIRGTSTPKAGVFAVRQGPILWENIRRSLRGRPLLDYRPQRRFLKLLNTGDGSAIGEWGGHSFRGSLTWWLKDRIDRKFMAMYQDYTPGAMRGADSADSEHEPVRQLRCLGCGGKVGGQVLSRVLARLEIPPHASVPLGLASPDDVALVQSQTNQPLAVTTDFFVPPLDDAYLVGRLAALHAASDVLAKGARPIAALAIATVPPGPEKQQEQLLYDLLAGGLHELRAMGATLAGGHTIEGLQSVIGYTIIAEPRKGRAGDPTAGIRTKGGLRPGDVLILTKPLGVGVLLAAYMQGRLKAAWYEPLIATLVASNQAAAEVLDEFDVAAATDVTGFGLAGHLLEMLRASDVSAEIQLGEIPLLDGVIDLFGEGLKSTLDPSNRAAEQEMLSDNAGDLRAYPALFDPQTCGGLLFGVRSDQVSQCLARLAATPTSGTVIGRVLPADEEPPLRVLWSNGSR